LAPRPATRRPGAGDGPGGLPAAAETGRRGVAVVPGRGCGLVAAAVALAVDPAAGCDAAGRPAHGGRHAGPSAARPRHRAAVLGRDQHPRAGHAGVVLATGGCAGVRLAVPAAELEPAVARGTIAGRAALARAG